MRKLTVAGKIVDVLTKWLRSGEKEQDIDMKKIEIFAKVVSVIIYVTLFMCVILSFFPSQNAQWWFDLLTEMIEKL